MKAQHLATWWKVKWRSIFSGKVEDSLSTQTIFHLNVSPFSPIRDMINKAMFFFSFFFTRGEFTWCHHLAMFKSIMLQVFLFSNLLLKAAVILFKNTLTLFVKTWGSIECVLVFFVYHTTQSLVVTCKNRESVQPITSKGCSNKRHWEM